MKRNMWIGLIVAVVILLMISCYKREELFDNSGALMQLSTSHVPSGVRVPDGVL
jgi:hypothetical protein